MALQKTSVTIIDRINGQPAIILPNGNWAQFDNLTAKYKDTGVRATPQDDKSAIKYFKRTNSGTVPSAPNNAGSGYATESALDAAMEAAGWSCDPLPPNNTEQYMWMAWYGAEYKMEVQGGSLKQVAKYTLTNVGLYLEQPLAPTIELRGDQLVINNHDGSNTSVQIPTVQSVQSILDLTKKLQEQIDGAVYAYNGQGKPSMTTAPVTDWVSEVPASDTATRANIYYSHVGDTFTDLTTGVSYRFTRDTAKAQTDPTAYKWEVISDSAITQALKDIADLKDGKRQIFTTQPVPPYDLGDMWIDTAKKTYRLAVQGKEAGGTFDMLDWSADIATTEQLQGVQKQVNELSGHLDLANKNITDIQNAFTDYSGILGDSLKDKIIDEGERQRIKATQERVVNEAEQLRSNVNYINQSQYLTAEQKSSLTTLLTQYNTALEALNASINTAISDSVITDTELSDYNTKTAAYNAKYKALVGKIAELDKLAKDAIPATVKVGARNLYSHLCEVYQCYIGGTNNGKIIPLRKRDTNYLYFLTASGNDTTLRVENIFRGAGEYTVTYEIKINGAVPFETKVLRRSDPVNSSRSVNGQYIRVSFTVKITDEEAANLAVDNFFNIYFHHEVFVEIQNLKVEKGNVATDWTPAPEDVEADIAEINAHQPRVNPTTKNWQIWDANTDSYKDTQWSSVGDDGKAPRITSDGYWEEYDPASGSYKKTSTKAAGVDGEQGLSVRDNLLTYALIDKTWVWKPTEAKGDYKLAIKDGVITCTGGDGCTDDVNTPAAYGAIIINRSVAMDGAMVYAVSLKVRLISGQAKIATFGNSGYIKFERDVDITSSPQLLYCVYSGSNKNAVSFSVKMTTGSVFEVYDIKIERVPDGETQIPTAYIPHGDDLKGAAGQDALNIRIEVQGEFATDYVLVDESTGQALETPQKVTKVAGGVLNGAGAEVVQCKAVITKGTRNVTETAKSAITWHVNGTLKATGVTSIDLTKEDYADGIPDRVEIALDDANANDW